MVRGDRNEARRWSCRFVDDEPLVSELLGSVVEDAGWRFESAGTAEAALDHARSKAYDLIIVDKNLPGHDGVDLIGQLMREGNDAPCVLVTGFPSAETISRALAQGAVDYITKPFDEIEHLQKRLSSIVDQRRQTRVVGQMVRDLSEIAEGSGADTERVRGLGMELFAQKQKLASRPDLLIHHVERGLAEQVGRLLVRAGISVVYPEGDDLPATVKAQSPMCVFLNLEVPGSAALVERLHGEDPAMAVLVSGRENQLDDALGAVRAGAIDFVLGAMEGPDVLVRRVRRAAARARKVKLQQRLVTLLHRVSLDLEVDLTEPVGGLVKEESGATPPAPAEGEDVDISDLFEDEHTLSGEEGGPMALGVDESALALSRAGTSVQEQIDYGLDSVDAERRVDVNALALLRAYRTLVETMRFFSDVHQPSQEETARFVGDAESGAMAAWTRAYHDLRAQLPDDVVDELDWGLRFAHPWPPYYLKG
jgi:DNA-binding response OmpR family regulator